MGVAHALHAFAHRVDSYNGAPAAALLGPQSVR
jgi:hypothetical protein